MKTILSRAFFFLMILSVLISCNKTEANLPECSITDPSDGDEFIQGEVVTILAEASVSGSIIDKVEIRINGASKAILRALPYSYEWNTTWSDPGNHTIKVTAFDPEGNSMPSEIGITVYNILADREGNEYEILVIGNQVWMTEDLKATQYADGTPIAFIETENRLEWSGLGINDKAYCFFDDAPNYFGLHPLGALYTWAAAMNGNTSSNADPSGVQGVCPANWHIPSDEEWKQLEMYVGLSRAEADAVGWRGTDEGGKLKQFGTSYWKNPNAGSINSSGFTARPTGFRSGIDGNFSVPWEEVHYWTSSETAGGMVWQRVLAYDTARVERSAIEKTAGLAVRCVMD